MARVRSGDRVLIECATGGVGTLAVQMAKHAGADVLGLTTSASKLDYIRALGVEAMTREAFDNDAKQRHFDFILNASGGRSVARQKSRLNITGRMVCMGLNSEPRMERETSFASRLRLSRRRDSGLSTDERQRRRLWAQRAEGLGK